MGLMKSPSLLTFILTVVLAASALAAKLGVALPDAAAGASFWMLFAAYVLLMLGVITRGL
ncbi:MAG: hypothetical protein AAFQ45_02150 [Pseudomonadota bacterium]